MTFKSVPLGRIATLEREGVDPATILNSTRYVGLEHIDSSGELVAATVNPAELASTKFTFTRDHILYGKLRPYLRKIAKPELDGICSTDIIPIRPSAAVDRAFLFHFLRTDKIVDKAASLATGINLPRLNPRILESFEVPLPPLEEQRRIATILDQADELRRKRRESLERLATYARAVFNDFFGSRLVNPRGWNVRQFADLLEIPLRNGVSPSSTGTIHRTLLTLSAVTGAAFDGTAVKQGSFETDPPAEKRVTGGDFLICRGNGNINLVGRGFFVTDGMSEIVFPDTMIAARISRSQAEPSFFEFLWNSQYIRSQIGAAARTTNGTFKINQGALERIGVLVPPIDLQRAFAAAMAEIDKLKALHRAHLSKLDALFASLQHRAFRGEL